jgi:hypothetical protein
MFPKKKGISMVPQKEKINMVPQKEKINMSLQKEKINMSLQKTTTIPPHPQLDITKKPFLPNLQKQTQAQKKIEDRIDPIGLLPWTHNTTPFGLIGILATDSFLSSVEEHINFRYDIDSRYHGGVTIVMKQGLEWRYDESYIQDLYKQSQKLRGVSISKVFTRTKYCSPQQDQKSLRLNEIKEHLKYITDKSNYRDTQIDRLKNRKLCKKNENSNLAKHNYVLSLVNPQLRIPATNQIKSSDIDFVIITKEASQELRELCKTREKTKQEINTFLFSLKAKMARPPNLITNIKAGIAQLIKMKSEMNLIEVDVNPVFSHDAGRMNERSLQGEEKINEAGGLGMELSDEYYDMEINNSPRALTMEAFLAFQTAYYKKIAQNEAHTGNTLALDRLTQRQIPLPQEQNFQLA